MVQVKDKTGRILYTVERQIRKQPRSKVMFAIQCLLMGAVFYGFLLIMFLVGAIL